MAKRKPARTPRTSRSKKPAARAGRPRGARAPARPRGAKAPARRERALPRPTGRPVSWVCSGCGRSFRARAVYRCPTCAKPVRYVGPRISAPDEEEGTGMWVPSRSTDLVSWSGPTGKHSAEARASRPSARVPVPQRPARRPAAARAPAPSKKAAPRTRRTSALKTIRKAATRLIRKVRKVATRIGRKVAPKAKGGRRTPKR